VFLVLGGCRPWSQAAFLASYDREIASATRAIETARDDAHRAEAYTKRGGAYSEKARYSRAFKLISPEEYARLFGLAIRDHDRAIVLDPASAEAYFTRGQAYYDRAILEIVVKGALVGTAADWKFWSDPAIADFKKAIEKDARHALAWERLGLIHETIGAFDEAVVDYTHETALDSSVRNRLADAYCLRGERNENEKKYDAAIADYEQSVANGAIADGCSCDPYNPLLALYKKDRRYEQVWVVVHKGWAAGKWIDPDLLAIVRRESGRRE
jgi:tetratricopeptide (TPR) repeat protein